MLWIFVRIASPPFFKGRLFFKRWEWHLLYLDAIYMGRGGGVEGMWGYFFRQGFTSRANSFFLKLAINLTGAKCYQNGIVFLDNMFVHYNFICDFALSCSRYFNPWCSWALERHDRHVKSEEFRQRRITKLVCLLFF